MVMVRLLWLFLACSASLFAQSFEASLFFGTTDIPSKSENMGTPQPDPTSGSWLLKGGFRIGGRMTLNQGRFFGHEFGYAYNRTSVDVPVTTGIITTPGVPSQPGSGGVVTIAANNYGVASHQGFYDFLVYFTPEGFRVRPFATGGVQFTAFNYSTDYYGNRDTKYGVNYGAGVKVKVMENWGFRLDVRQYNMSKPFKLYNNSGRLLMWEFSGGVCFLL